MTEALTTSRERTQEMPDGRAGVRQIRKLVATLLAGALVGGAVFAVSQPSPHDVERAYWDQVIAYYQQTHTARSEASARSAALAELIEQTHWAAVVDYYEQQWAARAK